MTFFFSEEFDLGVGTNVCHQYILYTEGTDPQQTHVPITVTHGEAAQDNDIFVYSHFVPPGPTVLQGEAFISLME